MDTPLFERVELFARGLGESSDAVKKEMFRVSGAAGSEEAKAEWALRPEPTAGIVRAYIEHGMQVRPGPLRLWMLGPMFRYDRPQAGRYRQFTQWDVQRCWVIRGRWWMPSSSSWGIGSTWRRGSAR